MNANENFHYIHATTNNGKVIHRVTVRTDISGNERKVQDCNSNKTQAQVRFHRTPGKPITCKVCMKVAVIKKLDIDRLTETTHRSSIASNGCKYTSTTIN